MIPLLGLHILIYMIFREPFRCRQTVWTEISFTTLYVYIMQEG